MLHTRDTVYIVRKILRQGFVISMIMSPWGKYSNASQDNPSTIHHFEVASIKLNASNSRATSISPGVDTFDARNVTPKALLQVAYGMKSFQIIGGPKWLDSLHFDIHAKVRPEDVKPGVRIKVSSLQEALQQLLAERFALKTREVTRDGEILSLQVQNPKRLVVAAEQEQFTFLNTDTDLRATAATMSQLAEQLSTELFKSVVDDTHLSGRYDLNIKLSEGSTDVPSLGVERAATLIAALKTDCGLVLKKGRAPQRFLVVEQIVAPSED